MSLLRRRLMEDIPKTEPKGNVVKVVLRVIVEYSSVAPIFDVGFDINQVKYIRLVDDDREFDIGYTLDLSPGDYKLEIGLNELTNGDCMFYGIGLLSCDFSDVDISKMRSGRYMFAYTNIDKPPFFSLPDVRLTPNCFEGMFMGCASLVYAPVLPAETLVDGCYKNMFNGCTSLIFVKALFDGNPYEEAWPPPTEDWMLNVASEGTFVMSKDATFSLSEFSGVSGIPDGWSVVSSDELVNGKVVNNLSIKYGGKIFVGYPIILKSQFPVVSLVYMAGDGVAGSESIVLLRGLSIGYTSSPASYIDEIPLTNIVSGPKEDDCFLYELPDASDDKEFIVISVELTGDSNYTMVYAEKGMTWGEFADSRYTNVSNFHSDGVYIRYVTGEFLYHGDYELVHIEDLIDAETYYFVDSEY